MPPAPPPYSAEEMRFLDEFIHEFCTLMNESIDWDWVAREHAARFPARTPRSLQSAFAAHQKRAAAPAPQGKARERARKPPATPAAPGADADAAARGYAVNAARKRYTREQEDWLVGYVARTFDDHGRPRVWKTVADSYYGRFRQGRNANMLQQKYDDIAKKRRAAVSEEPAVATRKRDARDASVASSGAEDGGKKVKSVHELSQSADASEHEC